MSTGDNVDKLNNTKREPKGKYNADKKFENIPRFNNNLTILSQRTPSWVVEDIVSLLPDDVWNPHTKFLDIYGKSGIFLEVILRELEARADYSGIDGVDVNDPSSIREYIRTNQLYALCWSLDFRDFTRCNAWGETYLGEENIKFILESKIKDEESGQDKCRYRACYMVDADLDNEILKADWAGRSCWNCKDKCNQKVIDKYITDAFKFNGMLKEFFGDMKFDVVVGNPPYNQDIYLDFVQMGYNLATRYTLMITPAKWQAKGGAKNEAFRETIVPHMSKIVYYPDETDIFDITLFGGVSYYLIDKINKDKSVNLKNICTRVKGFNNEESLNSLNSLTQLNILGRHIISKLGAYSSIKLSSYDKNKRFGVALTRLFLYSGHSKYLYTTFGTTAVLSIPQILDKNKNEEPSSTAKIIVFSSDDIEVAYKFIRFVNSKFIRLLVLLGAHSQTNSLGDEIWRFVPDPGSFNKIFEDKPLPGYTPNEQGEYTDKDGNVHCSLYVKYKLTPEEINIIESVIKERK